MRESRLVSGLRWNRRTKEASEVASYSEQAVREQLTR